MKSPRRFAFASLQAPFIIFAHYSIPHGTSNKSYATCKSPFKVAPFNIYSVHNNNTVVMQNCAVGATIASNN
jgi:hypothetical protein